MLKQTRSQVIVGLPVVMALACSPAIDSQLEENKQVVRRLIESMDRGDFEIFDELLSPDIVVHFPGAELDRVQTEETARSFYQAFPDLRHTVEDLMAVGDKVVLRATDRGTHQGEFLGIPPTGRVVEFGVIVIYRIVDGRIVEIWEEGDLLGLTQQLGVEQPSQQ